MSGRGARGPVLALILLSAACSGGFVKEYEHEEELFLDLDGSATVIVNTSVPATVALHGAPLDPDPRARFDRSAVRRLFEAAGTRVTRVSRPWRRHGRRFFQVRVEVDDVTRLSQAAPFAWSAYEFRRRGEEYVYRQRVTRGAADAAPEGEWRGDELVAFRLHVPSRIRFHNATTGEVARGNILVWEQPLRDRLAGAPLEIEARMETESILYQTLWLFGGAFLMAVGSLAGAVWLIMRR